MSMAEADSKAEDDSRGSWKDIIVLLRGDLRAGAIASQVLADVLVEDELREVFHELCTRYLITKEWTARTNAGSTIKNLCQKFSSSLTPLVTRSMSDGELLTLSELDILAVSRCKGAELLSGNCHSYMHVEGKDLYSKAWLKKQRRALRKRLGLEASTADAAVALDYISSEVFVDDSDLTGRSSDYPFTGSSQKKGDKMDVQTPNLIPETPSSDVNGSSQGIDADTSDTEQSTETWFARYQPHI